MAEKSLSPEEIEALKNEILADSAADDEPEAGAAVESPGLESADALEEAPTPETAAGAGIEGDVTAETSDAPEAVSISEEQMDALGEFFNIAMGRSATVLSSLLERPVDITTPTAKVISWEEVRSSHPVPCLIVKINYLEGLEGENVLVIEQRDANVIANLMDEADEPLDAPLDEYRTGVLGEAMNQMVGGAAVSMSEMLGRDINISPPKITSINLMEEVAEQASPYGGASMLQISFKFVVEGLINSEMLQLMDAKFAVKTSDELLADEYEPDEAPAEPERAAVEPPVEAPQPRPRPEEPPVTVGRAQFQPLQPEGVRGGETGDNYQIIMDVELEITVELGRTRMMVKDILGLGEGSIIELDKMVGEPVEIYANERLIAWGEVVVVDEDFGVRITEIVKKTGVRSELV